MTTSSHNIGGFASILNFGEFSADIALVGIKAPTTPALLINDYPILGDRLIQPVIISYQLQNSKGVLQGRVGATTMLRPKMLSEARQFGLPMPMASHGALAASIIARRKSHLPCLVMHPVLRSSLLYTLSPRRG